MEEFITRLDSMTAMVGEKLAEYGPQIADSILWAVWIESVHHYLVILPFFITMVTISVFFGRKISTFKRLSEDKNLDWKQQENASNWLQASIIIVVISAFISLGLFIALAYFPMLLGLFSPETKIAWEVYRSIAR